MLLVLSVCAILLAGVAGLKMEPSDCIMIHTLGSAAIDFYLLAWLWSLSVCLVNPAALPSVDARFRMLLLGSQ